MRLFGIESDGGLTPYPPSAFDEGEAIIEDWLESNPRAILEDDPLLLIGRQVRTDRGKRIDLLGMDRAGSVVVVELKRGRTPRDVVAQALEYAAFAARLDVDDLEKLLRSYENDESLGLADRHGEHFGIRESVAFNKDQRIVIVGQPVAPEVRQVASFLSSKGIGVACVEFNLFEERGGGGRLLSMEVVAGDETTKPGPVVSDSRPVLTEAGFLERCDPTREERHDSDRTRSHGSRVSRTLRRAGEIVLCSSVRRIPAAADALDQLDLRRFYDARRH